MRNGFIFECYKKFFFIECDYERKTKTIANAFTKFFINNCGFTPTNEMIGKTREKIFKEMYKATVKRSNDFTQYFINGKYNGATVDEIDMIFLEM